MSRLKNRQKRQSKAWFRRQELLRLQKAHEKISIRQRITQSVFSGAKKLFNRRSA